MLERHNFSELNRNRLGTGTARPTAAIHRFSACRDRHPWRKCAADAGLSSRTTRDIDICAAAPSLSGPFPERGARLPVGFMAAVVAVAHDLGLSPDWLNTAAEEVVDVYGVPSGLVQRLVIRDYGPTLRAGFLSRFDQIHFKILAAADPKAPERHIEDLRHRLQPMAKETEAAVEWLLARQTSSWFRAQIRKIVKALGHEDIAHCIPR